MKCDYAKKVQDEFRSVSLIKNIAEALIVCLIRTGSKICTARSDLTFSNKHFDSVAMPCPACLVARRRVESFNVAEIRNYEMHLTVSHGMER